MNQSELDLNQWVTIQELAKRYRQFSLSQLKHLIWKRREHHGLARCYRIIGKKGYINLNLFTMWMNGELPEQNGATDK
ncbi:MULTISPECIES: hypothetical protein [Vibrio oreintalis group]|uniref:Excisionase n=1 Tax=Vibrio tubiashii ATCC 19109 TaxID=1051646 RepID=F9TC43_9VIBR|nr:MULTISPECIES: hypothetical protein [Vibrio oreintalis group]AIW15086.1 hypothetical protein IX91_13060 [Vibrio tubiashii ATCC 19109]EGU48180.1 hypothetical protein VITU9109_11920 [Vibrio tubiashii ATCC 19109]EIF05376.1 hypothetical protein VT1337_03810 [Vibrio tubiashii NCIMB 1337 = ATCC 19106]MDC5813047.1 hypothetical protein [Vibrio europaeus]QPG36058.1 hypothetical protein IXK98_21805 [Vibrio europaeus]